MTVTLKNAGNTVITLCHGSDLTQGHYTGPGTLRFALTREVQAMQSIGAEETALAARKNTLWTITFSAAAEFDTPEAAVEAAADLAKNIREIGDTPHILTIGSAQWGQAVVTAFDASPIGCTLTADYTLTAAQAQ